MGEKKENALKSPVKSTGKKAEKSGEKKAKKTQDKKPGEKAKTKTVATVIESPSLEISLLLPEQEEAKKMPREEREGAGSTPGRTRAGEPVAIGEELPVYLL